MPYHLAVIAIVYSSSKRLPQSPLSMKITCCFCYCFFDNVQRDPWDLEISLSQLNTQRLVKGEHIYIRAVVWRAIYVSGGGQRYLKSCYPLSASSKFEVHISHVVLNALWILNDIHYFTHQPRTRGTFSDTRLYKKCITSSSFMSLNFGSNYVFWQSKIPTDQIFSTLPGPGSNLRKQERKEDRVARPCAGDVSLT